MSDIWRGDGGIWYGGGPDDDTWQGGGIWGGPTGKPGEADRILDEIHRLWASWSAGYGGMSDGPEDPEEQDWQRAGAYVTTHRVVVHHFTPQAIQEQHRKTYDLALLGLAAHDRKVQPVYECSLPVDVVVSERRAGNAAGAFDVTGIPNECGICKRAFFGRDKEQIRRAAVADHLRAKPYLNTGGSWVPSLPLDVVLDI